jgi:predicted enzyme related to lactoylglutathione lyase
VLRIGNVTFDCEHPPRVAEFWAAALGYQVKEASEFFAEVVAPDGTRPNLLFIKVPEPRTGKNRVHVDLGSDDREGEIERLVGLGATRGETHTMAGITWTVLQDPEGNEFCVGQPEAQ